MLVALFAAIAGGQAFGQFVSGNGHATASTSTDPFGTLIGNTSSFTLETDNSQSVSAVAPPVSGVTARSQAGATVSGPKIDLQAGGKIEIDGGARGAAESYSTSEAGFLDTIWFYTREVPYATLMNVQLRVQVDDTFFPSLLLGDQDAEATYWSSGHFSFQVIDDDTVYEDTYDYLFSRDENGVPTLSAEGDRFLDLNLTVPNTPNRHYRLRMNASVSSGASGRSAENPDPSGGGSSVSFFTSHSLAWVGLLSATNDRDGRDIAGPIVTANQTYDYGRSYVDAAPVPEPAAYAISGALALLLLCAFRRTRLSPHSRRSLGAASAIS